MTILHVPAWMGSRILTNHIDAWPTFSQRAIFWLGRQWYVVRRRRSDHGLYRFHIEWSRAWGASLCFTLGHIYFEVGWTGAQVLDLKGRVAGSVLGPARL